MCRAVLTVFAAAALVAAGSVVSNAGQTSASGHHKRVVRQSLAHPPGSDITSFSSSSVLHVGVNRPPKNK